MSTFESVPETIVCTGDVVVSDGGSPVTTWLRSLQTGDSESAGDIYQYFCTRLQNLVRNRIPGSIRAAYDHDDVTVSAFHSLFLGVREQRYRLNSRSDIWRLLLLIAERKIAKRIRYETRDKRDVRRRVQDSVFLRLSPKQQSEVLGGVGALPGDEPTPEFAAEVAETCENLLASLPDDSCRRIALLMLENYTAEQIAEQLGCARRTVHRKLLVIRRTWQHASGTSFPE